MQLNLLLYIFYFSLLNINSLCIIKLIAHKSVSTTIFIKITDIFNNPYKYVTKQPEKNISITTNI